MSNDGITAITLTTDEGSVTVSSEALHRSAESLKRRSRPTTTATRRTVYVPAELDFGDTPFIPSPDLQEMAGDLIEMHPDILGHLADVEVAYFWKKTGGKRGGKGVFGKAIKPSGLLTAFTTADAVIWLAADHVAEADYTPRQIEALLFHEMQHVGVEEPDPDDEDAERKIVMRPHDVELFLDDVKTYGAWDDLLREAAAAFTQAPLFAES